MKIKNVIPLLLMACIGISGCSFEPFISSEEQASYIPISLPQPNKELSVSEFSDIVSSLVENEKRNIKGAKLDTIYSDDISSSKYKYTQRDGENFTLVYEYSPAHEDYILIIAYHYSSDYKYYEAMSYDRSYNTYEVVSDTKEIEFSCDSYVSGFAGSFGVAPAADIAFYGNLVPNTPGSANCDNIRTISKNEVSFRINFFTTFANCRIVIENGCISCFEANYYDISNPNVLKYKRVTEAEFGDKELAPIEAYNAYINRDDPELTKYDGEYMVLMGPQYINGQLNDWTPKIEQLSYAVMYETELNDLLNDSSTSSYFGSLYSKDVQSIYRIDNVEFGTHDTGENTHPISLGNGKQLIANTSYAFRIMKQVYKNRRLQSFSANPTHDYFDCYTSNLVFDLYTGRLIVTDGPGIYTVVFVKYEYDEFGFAAIKMADLEGVDYIYTE